MAKVAIFYLWENSGYEDAVRGTVPAVVANAALPGAIKRTSRDFRNDPKALLQTGKSNLQRA